MDEADGTESRLRRLFEAGQWCEAFDLAYQAYYPQIAGFCVNRLATNVYDCATDGEEIAQQVFLEFSRTLKQGRFRWDCSSVRTSLFNRALHRCIDRIRAAKRDGLWHGDNVSQMEVAGRQPLPEEALLNEEGLRLLRRHIEALRDIDRDIVVLRYYYDFPAAEIARIVDRTPENVRKRLSRALRTLKEGLLGEA